MAETAGLVLGVIPLIISAIENYDSILQPVKIFTSTYQVEVEQFRRELLLEQNHFREECKWLLKSVLASDDARLMVKDAQHPLWQNYQSLDDQLGERLNDNYEACEAALKSIVDVLGRILDDTKDIGILMKDRPPGYSDPQWRNRRKRFKQRFKISFRKKNFKAQLDDLHRHIGSLQTTRKYIDDIQAIKNVPTASSFKPFDDYQAFQHASFKLYEALSSVWRCDEPQEHFASLSIDDQPRHDTQEISRFRFDLAWTCPTQYQSSACGTQTLRLSVEAYQERPSGAASTSLSLGPRQRLEDALRLATRSQGPSNTKKSPVISNSQFGPPVSPPDLDKIPNLCQHLRQNPGLAHPAPCAGFLQKSKTFKHYIYMPNDNSSGVPQVETLEDILSRSKPILPGDQLRMARSLAVAVLQYHSTPWLKQEWRSEDIVFFGIQDQSPGGIRSPRFTTPHLKATVKTRSTAQVVNAAAPSRSTGTVNPPNKQTLIRNQTLFNLGVMLVELAYNAPLHDLELPQDDQGRGDTPYWTALRLAHDLGVVIGTEYAEVVKVCLHCSLGPADDLNDQRLRDNFLREVVQRLAILQP